MADTKHATSRAGMIRFVVVTPETTVVDTHAKSVTLPLFDGSRGVARGHSPFIGRLGAGEVRLSGEADRPGDGVRRLFVQGGFVEVGHDVVTVVTQRAIPQEKLDGALAREELAKLGSSRATGDEAIAAKLDALDAARALVRTAGR
jgi:F-type H+-transporting ATPase subunit epsilon